MKEKDLEIINHMRKGKRMNISGIARQLKLPISTVNDRIRQIEKKHLLKYSAILDFKALGYLAHAKIAVKLKNNNDSFLEYVKKHSNVNSIYSINDGYDYLIEVVFKDYEELKRFAFEIENKFGLQECRIFHIYSTIRKEEFGIPENNA